MEALRTLSDARKTVGVDFRPLFTKFSFEPKLEDDRVQLMKSSDLVIPQVFS